jgi:hypothetical protein
VKETREMKEKTEDGEKGTEVLLLDEDGQPIGVVPSAAIRDRDGFVEIDDTLVPNLSFREIAGNRGCVEVREHGA